MYLLVSLDNKLSLNGGKSLNSQFVWYIVFSYSSVFLLFARSFKDWSKNCFYSHQSLGGTVLWVYSRIAEWWNAFVFKSIDVIISYLIDLKGVGEFCIERFRVETKRKKRNYVIIYDTWVYFKDDLVIKSHCPKKWTKERHKSKNRFCSFVVHWLALARKETDHS